MTRPDCQVFVNGTKFADRGDDLLSGALTALGGLKLQWGRDSAVDQPDPATVSFTATSRPGTNPEEWLVDIHVGTPIDVWSTGQLGTDGPPVQVAADPSFEATPDPAARCYLLDGQLSAASSAQARTGAHAIASVPIGSYPLDSVNRWVAFAPAPFTPADANGWTDVPTLQPNQEWTLSAWVRVPIGGYCPIGYSTWRDPRAASGLAVSFAGGEALTGLGPNDWQQLTITVNTNDITLESGPTWIGPAIGYWDRVPWSNGAGTWAAQLGTWADWYTTIVDDIAIMAPPSASRRVAVFSGRITDVVLTGDSNAVDVAITAIDTYADMANDAVGDIPWPIDLVVPRVTRIQNLSATDFIADIDTSLNHYHLTQEDIDAQTVADLLGQVAQSIDAVLWSAFDPLRGFYIWFEDPALRQSLAVFALVDGVVVISGNVRPARGINLTACDLLADGVQWEQNVADILTRISLTWLDQTVLDDEGLPSPTETYIILSDNAGIASYGIRSLSVSTDLTTAADGTAVANRLLNRSRVLGWHMTGLMWDNDIPETIEWTPADTSNALDCLDGTRRVGLPIHLSDLPDWSPVGDDAGVYLEGGSYVFSGGRWQMAMNVSPSGVTGRSAAWHDLDATWKWNQFDPDIAWENCYGVGT